jgi:hypothetical protein
MLNHHALENIPETRPEGLRLRGHITNQDNERKPAAVTAILLPVAYAVFHTDGSFLGTAMENSAKQNHGTGF